MKPKFILIIFALVLGSLHAQQPNKLNSAQIYKAIEKLNFFGTVLYLGAHPDDENTQMISYFSNDCNANTAYLSMTRGDGGQNLIGPELQELLGVIRTQELLGARRIDGGRQFFTRANDFGYSKHPEETFSLWNKDSILKDVVTLIRKFKPDIIIDRFDHRTPGTTHGQHTASAILSYDAFNAAADPAFKSFADAKPWQPRRLFFNTSWWFYGSQENFEKADKSKMLNFDMGNYYPDLGLSNNEIAALSRSQHKSQGFGSTGRRGSNMEYLELIRGDLPKDKTNIFEGIDTSWTRVTEGKAIGDILSKVQAGFNFEDPAASIPELLKAYRLIDKIQDDYWREIKLQQIKDIIAACSGLYLEAIADTQLATPGSVHKIAIEAINRSPVSMNLVSIQISGNEAEIIQNKLSNNIDFTSPVSMTIPPDARFTTPYWLIQKGSTGRYQVSDTELIGLPETPKTIQARFDIQIENTQIPFYKNVIYKYNDPVKGEVYQPFEIVPQVTVSVPDKVIIFSGHSAKQIPVTISTLSDTLTGAVTLCHPDGWKVSPEKVEFKFEDGNKNVTKLFTVTPPDTQSEGMISPLVTCEGKEYTLEMTRIDYDHIPRQTVLSPSQSKVVRMNIQTVGNQIAYIPGAGDKVPESLRQIGYNVTELNDEDIKEEKLKNFDAVILGIRTYNINDNARFWQKELHEYVSKGGTVIVQYNTDRGLKVDGVAPYPLKLSRDRVVEEDAKVTLVDPDNPLLSYPNKITEADFEGWIQERGLYFPDQW
ncbi:MAG: PIG-L family deacetylase, partial [Flavobacteriaceae bacterium]|nr:PIG-L family deacetylase [Flavobacteriaceae bacterium]